MDYEKMDPDELVRLARIEKMLTDEGDPEAKQILDQILPILRARGEDVSELEA